MVFHKLNSIGWCILYHYIHIHHIISLDICCIILYVYIVKLYNIIIITYWHTVYHVQFLTIFHPLPFAMTLRPAARMLALSEGASTPQHQGPLIFLMDKVPWFLHFKIKPSPNQLLEWFYFFHNIVNGILQITYWFLHQAYQKISTKWSTSIDYCRKLVKFHWTQRREVRKARTLSPSPSLLSSFDLQTIFILLIKLKRWWMPFDLKKTTKHCPFQLLWDSLSCLMASKISMACCHCEA